LTCAVLRDLEQPGTSAPRRVRDGVDTRAAGGIARRVLQDQRPRLIEGLYGIDAGNGGEWLRHALEQAGGLEVALFWGHVNRERSHQDVGPCRRTQFTPPERPAGCGEPCQIVV